MIVYDPNKHFVKDIWNLTRSYTMRRLLWYVMGMGALSAFVCAVLGYTAWYQHIKMDVSIFSFLGIVLSILLVFRTNAAYDDDNKGDDHHRFAHAYLHRLDGANECAGKPGKRGANGKDNGI